MKRGDSPFFYIFIFYFCFRSYSSISELNSNYLILEGRRIEAFAWCYKRYYPAIIVYVMNVIECFYSFFILNLIMVDSWRHFKNFLKKFSLVNVMVLLKWLIINDRFMKKWKFFLLSNYQWVITNVTGCLGHFLSVLMLFILRGYLTS